MIIGARVRELRKKLNLSQQELGNMLNVTKVSVSCYESEKRSPDIETFEALVNALETTPDYLLGRDKLVISEGETRYKVFLPNTDLEIISEIRKHPELIKFLRNDPKRGVELLAIKISK